MGISWRVKLRPWNQVSKMNAIAGKSYRHVILSCGIFHLRDQLIASIRDALILVQKNSGPVGKT